MSANASHLRFYFTRLLYFFLRFRIGYWRRKVETLWSMGNEKRVLELERWIKIVSPTNAEDVSVTSLSDLKKSPIMEKKLLQKRTASELSWNGSRITRHTAGTSGEPTQIWLKKDELSRMLAVRDYCLNYYGIKIGEREARLWGRPQEGLKTHIKNLLMNRKVFHPVGKHAYEQIKAMFGFRPAYIYGYSSLILEAANIINESKLTPPSIKLVVCTAETILPSQKKFISDVFKAPVAEEYGSTEFDVIAFECRRGHRHLVNPWLIVEENNGNCIVSDTSRLTQSFIRYNLGDSIKLFTTDCKQIGDIVILKSIEGRSIDRFANTSDGKKFHSVEFAYAIDSYCRIHKVYFTFSVIQTKPGFFSLFLNKSSPIHNDSLCEWIEDHINKITNSTIKISVDSAPPKINKRSSKHSYFFRL